ncbi:MAG TPA: hypothetical protein VGJ70_16850 [Solirubrobacteraceae bacterium]
MRTQARFVDVGRDAGHYESFYVKACHPREPRAVWIRHTVWKAPGADAVGSLWCTLFDAAWERPVAWKETRPPAELGVGEGEYLHVGAARLTDGLAEAPGRWRLEFTGDDGPFAYLPRAWMYRARLPRTKAESLYPKLRFSGWVELDGRRIELDGWPGMIGHNWGAEHAERWIWLHGATFEEAPGAVFDAIMGRVKVGRWTAPWIANGFLELEGRRHRLGGLGRARSTRVEEAPDRCAFVLAGADGLVVEGEVVAPYDRLVGWTYSDPGGGRHDVLHSSIADVRLVVRRPGRSLTALGGATYEIGMRESGHGVPIEPFPDP